MPLHAVLGTDLSDSEVSSESYISSSSHLSELCEMIDADLLSKTGLKDRNQNVIKISFVNFRPGRNVPRLIAVASRISRIVASSYSILILVRVCYLAQFVVRERWASQKAIHQIVPSESHKNRMNHSHHSRRKSLTIDCHRV